MTIAEHEGRRQVCCDSCPAAYPNTYAADDFAVMIADAKAAGWRIRKLPADVGTSDTQDLFGRAPVIAGAKKPEPYTHTCPTCAASANRGSLL